ncbi:MAG TPA: response regulator transcription factor [Candidatus Fimihabitans intestinipullorum]|uniref:Response regulator transcription factor n=1 Tax=Candidatus Fimihabitans intestinipullorum TaxID=2840820 RepID=A0A9D1HX72_9BACT|nr:response regulator transcription factor [Candidatus Fimihabitans intestinipullorum]
MKRILIVEDDVKLREELKVLLDHHGYEATIQTDMEHILESIVNGAYDLVLLDINLPHTSGVTLLKDLRKTSDVPVIMVTSQNTEVDEVVSMSYGADDYITKPYHPTLLLLHIEALLKRIDHVSSVFSYQNIQVIPEKGVIKTSSLELPLSKNEMQIFCYLLKHQGKIVSREDIMNYLWDTDLFIDDNTLTVNISRLRNRLREVGLEDVIETRKGQGYLLK